MPESERTLSIPAMKILTSFCRTPIRAIVGLIRIYSNYSCYHESDAFCRDDHNDKHYFVVTHGLPLRLDIDRFHVSRLIFGLHSATTVQQF